jgi:hypothetical protein
VRAISGTSISACLPCRQYLGDGAQVDLGLAAAGDAMQQHGMKALPGENGCDGRMLGRHQLRQGGRRRGGRRDWRGLPAAWQLAAAKHGRQGEGRHLAQRRLVVARAEFTQGQPLGRQWRHVAQDGRYFLQLRLRLFTHRRDSDDHSGPRSRAERHRDTQAYITFVRVRREVVEKPRQGYVEGDANDVHARSVACRPMLEKTLALALNLLL